MSTIPLNILLYILHGVFYYLQAVLMYLRHVQRLPPLNGAYNVRRLLQELNLSAGTMKTEGLLHLCL